MAKAFLRRKLLAMDSLIRSWCNFGFSILLVTQAYFLTGAAQTANQPQTTPTDQLTTGAADDEEDTKVIAILVGVLVGIPLLLIICIICRSLNPVDRFTQRLKEKKAKDALKRQSKKPKESARAEKAPSSGRSKNSVAPLVESETPIQSVDTAVTDYEGYADYYSNPQYDYYGEEQYDQHGNAAYGYDQDYAYGYEGEYYANTDDVYYANEGEFHLQDGDAIPDTNVNMAPENDVENNDTGKKAKKAKKDKKKKDKMAKESEINDGNETEKQDEEETEKKGKKNKKKKKKQENDIDLIDETQPAEETEEKKKKKKKKKKNRDNKETELADGDEE